MATNENCNSNPPSDRSTDNPSSSQDETRHTAPNAFKPEFLKKPHEREDAPLAALEAEMRGPWKVVGIPAQGAAAHTFAVDRWAVVRAWEDPQVDPPAGTFRFREVEVRPSFPRQGFQPLATPSCPWKSPSYAPSGLGVL